MSKRAKRIAKSMAKADTSFTGKSADRYLPLATAIDEGLRPFERAVANLLAANQSRIDANQVILDAAGTQSTLSDEQIAERVSRHLGSPNFTGMPALMALLPGDIHARMKADATVPLLLNDIDNVLADQPDTGPSSAWAT